MVRNQRLYASLSSPFPMELFIVVILFLLNYVCVCVCVLRQGAGYLSFYFIDLWIKRRCIWIWHVSWNRRLEGWCCDCMRLWGSWNEWVYFACGRNVNITTVDCQKSVALMVSFLHLLYLCSFTIWLYSWNKRQVLGAPEWLSWLSVRLQLRSWSHS